MQKCQYCGKKATEQGVIYRARVIDDGQGGLVHVAQLPRGWVCGDKECRERWIQAYTQYADHYKFITTAFPLSERFDTLKLEKGFFDGLNNGQRFLTAGEERTLQGR